MTETKDKEATGGEKKTLSLGGKATLSLKGNIGAVRSPGASSNSASVSVEVRRSRRTGTQTSSPSSTSAPSLEDKLTAQEREARAQALQKALEQGGRRTTLPKRQPIQIKQDEPKPEAVPVDNARSLEMEEARKIDEAERLKAGDNFRPVPGAPSAPGAPAFRRPATAAEEEAESMRDKLKKAASKQVKSSTDDRRRSRITVTQALNNDPERDRGPSMAAQRRAREKARLAARGSQEAKEKVLREVILPEVITVGELAIRMTEPSKEVIKALMKMGVMVTINQSIDADTAELVVTEFGHTVRRVTDADVEIGVEGTLDTAAELVIRAPVVTIMGHVDHGKTSLLDALRSTDVVSGEAGGITQHIGAYQVSMPSGQKITFLDTPGHAAFTEMRARGANATDIVVILVAANDSIMPQTVEAINHARAANVPIIIAINKIDLPDANPAKVKQDLLQHSVVIEELSGDVQCVEISAKKRMNLDKLEEAILIQAEVLELRANPNREAQGVVIESKLDKGRGPVATILVQKGTLKIGDIFIAGSAFGKVRAIINDHGKNIDEAGPGLPVEVLGGNGTAMSGDVFSVVEDESRAREITDYRIRQRRAIAAAKAVKGRTTLEDYLIQKELGEITKLPVIIKADVHGSVEAISMSLKKLSEDNPDVEVQILHSGAGGITESDVTLARASKALIIGFNVRAQAQARDMAHRDGVDIRYYNVIYDVIDDAKAILTGMLAPTMREDYLGQATIKQVFSITKVGKVAGCEVTIGMVKRGAKVRLLRDDVVIHEGKLKTLQRFKDEVTEVKEGTECGMAFEGYEDIRAGDIIECYDVIAVARKVE